ncbi:hypothetical protein ABK040_002518 [Willaertia magna]
MQAIKTIISPLVRFSHIFGLLSCVLNFLTTILVSVAFILFIVFDTTSDNIVDQRQFIMYYFINIFLLITIVVLTIFNILLSIIDLKKNTQNTQNNNWLTKLEPYIFHLFSINSGMSFMGSTMASIVWCNLMSACLLSGQCFGYFANVTKYTFSTFLLMSIFSCASMFYSLLKAIKKNSNWDFDNNNNEQQQHDKLISNNNVTYGVYNNN